MNNNFLLLSSLKNAHDAAITFSEVAFSINDKAAVELGFKIAQMLTEYLDKKNSAEEDCNEKQS